VLLWTLAGLTRGAAIPMAAVATTWLWLAQDQKLKKALYGTVVLLLFLGPLGFRSLEKVYMIAPAGIPQLNRIYARSGNEEINLEYRRGGAVWYFGFWSPSLGSEPFEPLSHWQTQRDGLVSVFIDVEKGAEDWNKALKEYEPSFSKYLWLVKENLIFLFFGQSWPDSNRERALGEISYQMRWIWAPLMLAVLVWTVSCRRTQRGDRLMLPAMILMWFVLQGLMLYAVNEGRYRKPLEGLLIAQIVLLAGTCRARASPPGVDRQSPEERRMAERRKGGERRHDKERRKGERRGNPLPVTGEEPKPE
jgi:hypothetical protein